jgi:hypothetical protein
VPHFDASELGMKVPGAFYTPSPRPYHGLTALTYPLHDWTGTLTHCGRICYKRQKVNLSQVFANCHPCDRNGPEGDGVPNPPRYSRSRYQAWSSLPSVHRHPAVCLRMLEVVS